MPIHITVHKTTYYTDRHRHVESCGDPYVVGCGCMGHRLLTGLDTERTVESVTFDVTVRTPSGLEVLFGDAPDFVTLDKVLRPSGQDDLHRKEGTRLRHWLKVAGNEVAYLVNDVCHSRGSERLTFSRGTAHIKPYSDTSVLLLPSGIGPDDIWLYIPSGESSRHDPETGQWMMVMDLTHGRRVTSPVVVSLLTMSSEFTDTVLRPLCGLGAIATCSEIADFVTARLTNGVGARILAEMESHIDRNILEFGLSPDDLVRHLNEMDRLRRGDDRDTRWCLERCKLVGSLYDEYRSTGIPTSPPVVNVTREREQERDPKPATRTPKSVSDSDSETSPTSSPKSVSEPKSASESFPASESEPDTERMYCVDIRCRRTRLPDLDSVIALLEEYDGEEAEVISVSLQDDRRDLWGETHLALCQEERGRLPSLVGTRRLHGDAVVSI